MFMAVFERKLGDAGFARLPRSSAIIRSYWSFVARERQIETEIAREFERDSAVLRGVRGGEKASVLAILHVFAARFRARANSHRFGKKLLATSLGRDRQRRRGQDLLRARLC